MAKYSNRVCANCSRIDYTASRSALCASCSYQEKRMKTSIRQKEDLERLNYTVVSGPEKDAFGHNRWNVITPCCRKEYSVLSNTVLNMMTRRAKAPCKFCGGKERTKEATKAYLEKYGRDWTDVDYDDWEKYRTAVRKLSEITYKTNISAINPNGLKRSRGTTGWHLDHKIPVVVCFRNKVSVEQAASFQNLRMLSGQENLSRSWYEYDQHLLEALKND